MSKKSSIVQLVLFSAVLAVFCLLFFLLPDTGFSERENREMTQVPRFSFDALFSGQFSKKFESYTTDQFPFRDSWTTVKAASELASGKKENNGVYLGDGDTLIEGYKSPDPKLLDTNINAVAAFASNVDIPVYFCLVPGIAGVNADLVPKNAPNDSQLDVIESAYARSGAENIDMYSALAAHKDEYIYYRTDHHWTSLGAFYGYEAIMSAMGRTTSPLSSFTPKTVSDEFYGTIYSKSGLSWVRPDSVEAFAEQHDEVQVFNYSTGEERETGLYDSSFLTKKDKYSYFMGGISPREIVKSVGNNAPSLLILRDSYADSLIPFIQSEFSEIHIMDLRYYRAQLYDSSLVTYIEENGIDEVLICYSVGNFGTDTNVFLMGQQ